MKTLETSVLVVGGSLVGLSSAVFLAWRGVPTLVVERHPGSSAHPRAIGFTPRTLELFRGVGLGDRIPQVPPGLRLRRVKAESLAGRWFDETPWTPEGRAAPNVEFSPCRGAALAQDRLEPILRQRALELGAELRLGTELLTFEQNGDGVVATIRDGNGEEAEVHARYMIAADGHRSKVREALGIGRSGHGHIRTVRSVMFRAPLAEYLQRGIGQFNIQQPDFEAFLTTYGDGRWLLIFSDDVERTDAVLESLLQKAIGRSDLPIEIVITGRWEVSALIADRFASGRIFIAGDAAHTLPPNRGGYGANTGIEDAHNLAWKLAAVLCSESTPELLESYDAERRPIAWLRHQQIFAREDFRALRRDSDGAEAVTIHEDAAMELGQLYRSAAVAAGDSALPPAARPDEWRGQPGTRAPHVWFSRGAERVSTLDLFQRSWVLLSDAPGWTCAAQTASKALGIAVESVEFSSWAEAEELRAAFGIERGGASLVRPDGYIAWRSPELPAHPERELCSALERLASARTSASTPDVEHAADRKHVA